MTEVVAKWWFPACCWCWWWWWYPPAADGFIRKELIFVGHFLAENTHTRTIVRKNLKRPHFAIAFLSDSPHQFVRFDAPFHINIHHSHKLTLHRTALWSIVHTSPPLAKRGDVFSKGGKREKEGEGEKEKRNGKSGATTSTGLPVDSCLFSLLLPPLSRSSTTSFAPSRPPEPNYHTTWPQNRPIGAVPSPRPWWITMARMQHVSGAARSTAAGVATSCLASLFHCHRILYIHSLLIFNANCNSLFLDNTHLFLS